MQQGIELYKRYFPDPPPPPTIGFNKLPNLVFPQPVEQLPAFEFKVETATGSLPAMPPSMKVYFMPKPLPTLDSNDRALEKARAAGFDSNPVQLSETVYSFTNSKAPYNMQMNIVTGNFSTSYNLAADSEPLSVPPPDTEEARRTAQEVLNTMKSLPEDLTGPVGYEFLRLEEQKLVGAPSLSEANFVKVNFTRMNFEEGIEPKKAIYPSLSANPTQSNVWFIVSGTGDKESKIVASEFHYYPMSEKFETYPIKKADVALEELKAGKGYIANMGLNRDGKVTIRKIYPAYYDSSEYQQFYQPIIVFEGDRGFFAYVAGVTSEFYGE
jgi:hypothetical protein